MSLYDEEREDFRQYLDFILYRQKEEWYAIDPKRLVTELNYNEQDFAELQENGVVERLQETGCQQYSMLRRGLLHPARQKH